MPIYEFRCENRECVAIGHVVEEFKRITDTEAPRCVQCGGEMKKILSRSDFRMRPLPKE